MVVVVVVAGAGLGPGVPPCGGAVRAGGYGRGRPPVHRNVTFRPPPVAGPLATVVTMAATEERPAPGPGPAGAIFDMDGLLVDSEPLWHEVEIEVFGAVGVPLTVARCLETKGMFLGEVVDHWYARYPWRGVSRPEVAARVVAAMAARLEAGVELKDGAGHALDFCAARGAALALASSSPLVLIEAVVRRLGLAHRFAVVRSAEQEAAGKPDPAIFLSTARLLGLAPRACVVFEDSPAGVAAARAAGMACVAVPEEEPGATATAPLADAVGQADVVLTSLRHLDEAVWAACTGPRLPGAGAGARLRDLRPGPAG